MKGSLLGNSRKYILVLKNLNSWEEAIPILDVIMSAFTMKCSSFPTTLRENWE